MRRLFPLFALFLALTARAEINPEWTTPLPPFQIAEDLYYVGSQELAAYLVTTPAGHILINANLETSPPQIRASVEKLGFQWADTKTLLNSQAHFRPHGRRSPDPARDRLVNAARHAPSREHHRECRQEV